MNAVESIKESLFYTSARYAQIRLIVDKVLTDQLTDSDLDGFVDGIALLSIAADWGVQTESHPSPTPCAAAARQGDCTPVKIKAITKISDARNVALIRETPVIELADGLNIFYGHNGDGKTTLCRAISNCLRLSEYSLDNIDSHDAQQAQVHLTVEDMQGNNLPIAWPSEKQTTLDPVKWFDANVCLALVENDQETTFSLAHLKQEYFALLGDALKGLSARVDERKRVIEDRLQLSSAGIRSAAPELLRLLTSLTGQKLDNISMSDEDRRDLERLEASLYTLERDELPGKIVVLANDISRLDEILSSVGESITNGRGGASTWILTCTQAYFDRMTELITRYNSERARLDERASTLARLVVETWPKNRQWQNFVGAALHFVRSLALCEHGVYRKEKCPYCQQPLSRNAKELLLAYEDIFGDAKSRLDGTETEIARIVDDATQRTEKVKMIPYKESLISQEGKCLKGGEGFRLPHILDILNQLVIGLATKSPVTVAPHESEHVALMFSHYQKWREAIIAQKDSYHKMAMDKTEETRRLRLQIAPLKERQLLLDNRAILREYLSLGEGLARLNRFRDFLTEARRQESLLATQFSSRMTIREFHTVLDREYDSLGFQKPRQFNLTCKTAVGTTKRVYTIADRRCRDILSEGEQKQHALADFFAQMELEHYAGLVVLDDPVTSLDELNTERVARRIVDLNEKHGNQIIVFTHNVFFLNALMVITHDDKVVHLSKSGDEIIVLPNAQLGNASAMRRRKKQIQEKMETVAQSPKADEGTLRSIYDLLSGYIEVSVETSLLKDVIGRYRPNIRIQSLPKIRWDNGVVGKLVELYNRTSRKGTRHSQPLSVPSPTKEECLSDAAEILDLIGAL